MFQVVKFHHPRVFTNQKITLTNNHEIPIITSPIAAYFKIVIPFEYFFSSPAEVTIRNPAYRQIARAIVAKIHSNQLMTDVIEESSLDPSCSQPEIRFLPPGSTRSVSAVSFHSTLPATLTAFPAYLAS